MNKITDFCVKLSKLASKRRRSSSSINKPRLDRGFEHLEARKVLSSASFVGGVLSISGTTGNDTIAVRQVQGNIKIDGFTGSIPVSSIGQINISTGAGNDKVTLQMDAAVCRKVYADLGSGRDILKTPRGVPVASMKGTESWVIGPSPVSPTPPPVLAAALTPTFETPVKMADGFTVQITNYTASYTWAGTATASGLVTISGSGLVTVTGVAAATSSTATITTTKVNTVRGSAPVTATSSPAATVPGAPSSVVGTAGNVQVALSWVAPASDGGSAITDYVVQYSNDNGFNWTTFNDGVSTATSATVSPLDNHREFLFRIAAINATGTGDYYSSAVSYTPDTPDLVAPTNVIATRVFSSQINVRWDDNNTSEAGYKIARSVSNLPWQDIGSVAANTNFFTDNQVLANRTYAYRITANNDKGLSPFSNVVIVSPITSSFAIQFSFGSSVRNVDKVYFIQAANRWSQVITGDLPDVDGVDDLLINVELTNIDGVGNTLGEALITGTRGLIGLPYRASIRLDTADFASLKANHGLLGVITHEIGHALGIGGSKWNSLVVGLGGPSPSFTGARAIAAYNTLAGSRGKLDGVPVEGSASNPGSRDSHWRESVFTNELMTPRLNTGIVPLSRLTVAAIADLGYVVNMSSADPYALASLADTATASGVVVVSGTGLVTVTGVAAATSSTATITTTKANTVGGSAPVTATSLANAVSNAPRSVGVVSGNAQLLVTWLAPTSTGGSPITDDLVKYSSNNGSTWKNFVHPVSTALSCTVTGLNNGTSYVIKVIARNAVGISLPSANSAPATPAATVSSAPRSVVAVSGNPGVVSGNTQLVVTWLAPTSTGGSPITDYLVKYSSNNGSTWSRFLPVSGLPIAALSCTVTGLNNGTSYVIKVIARNAVGISLPSANSAPVKSLAAALTPTFGPTTSTANGFTVQITNYSANYTWAGTATAFGTVAISGSGLVTVTGVAAATSSTATITTTKANTVDGSAPVTATSLAAALSPIFEAPVKTANGFTVQIANYDASYIWAGTATSGSVAISGSGLVTVTGVAVPATGTITITTTKAGSAVGSVTMGTTIDGFIYVSYAANVTIGRYIGSSVSITIPSSIGNKPVTNIGDSAFAGSTGLTAVTIPTSVTSIGMRAFVGCRGLTTVTIPASVTSIGSSAFEFCSGLTAVTIPASVTSIGNAAFAFCSGLTAVTISQGVTSIGVRAFSGCTGLTAVTIPTSVTSIGRNAFFDCIGLTAVTISQGVTNIGDGAFGGCTGLTELNFLGAPPQLDGILSVQGDDSTTIVKYPKGSGATTWVSFVGTLFGGLITQEST